MSTGRSPERWGSRIGVILAVAQLVFLSRESEAAILDPIGIRDHQKAGAGQSRLRRRCIRHDGKPVPVSMGVKGMDADAPMRSNGQAQAGIFQNGGVHRSSQGIIRVFSEFCRSSAAASSAKTAAI